MSPVHLTIVLAAFATLAACSCSTKPISDKQSVALCVNPLEWPKLVDQMDRFGKTHELKLIGGVDPNGPLEKPGLNVALAQGYNYYLGDDLDLWITNDPFRPNIAYFNAFSHEGPMTSNQWELARQSLRSITKVAPLAAGTRQEPHCPS